MFNRNFQRLIRGAFLVTSIFFSLASHADDKSGFYIGLGVGEATNKADEIDFDASDTAFKVVGGYSFNKYIAAEVGYIDAGSPDQQFGASNIKIEATGFTVAALGKLPIGNSFAFIGKLGYASYKSEATLSLGGGSISSDDDNEDLLYGIGAEVYLGNHFTLRAEYEAVDVPDGEFTIASLNGVVRF